MILRAQNDAPLACLRRPLIYSYLIPFYAAVIPRKGGPMRARQDGDRAPAKSPDFGKITGGPWVSKMAPFPLANRIRVPPKLRVI